MVDRPGDQKPRDPGGGEPLGLKGFFADLFQSRYREVTPLAIIFAILIGIVMNAAITYAGLTIGFTIGGSAIAAVLGFGVLRGILRQGTILETNIAQTIASAVNTSNSGIIFTVPVLFLIGYELTVGGSDFWLITLAAVAGALLGTAFIIPLRKQMLDIERLRFPSPTGVASILKSPGAGPAKALVLLAGCVIAAMIYLPAGLPAIDREASVGRLDDLFERGKITHEQRVRTRHIASWIQQQEAPELLLERGGLIHRLQQARARLVDLQQRMDELAEAVERATPELQEQFVDLGAGIEEAERRVAEGEARLVELREAQAAQAAEDPDVPVYPDALALRAYRASIGEVDWRRLRDRRIGWASHGLPGYSDLNWRLPDEPKPDAQPRDLTGDGQPDTVLTRRVDRVGDGRGDLILTDETIDVGRLINIPGEYQLVFAIAPFAIGAGYITGKAGLFVLAGGILAFFVISPLAYNLGWAPEHLHADQAPAFAFDAFNRPLGIGLLLGGALMGVLFSTPAIKEALKSIAAASRVRGGGDELGLKTLGVAVVAAIIFLFIAADVVGNRPVNLRQRCPVTQEPIEAEMPTVSYAGYSIALADEDAADQWAAWDDAERDAFLETIDARPGLLAALGPHWRAAIIAVIGALWIWFAGIIIAQCAGMTDWSPISGLALLTVILVLLLAGTGAVIGAVLLGAAMCVAITLAADMMGDMKTGYLVGSKPRRQQTVQLFVVALGPLIAMLTLSIIVQTNLAQHGVPIGPGTPTVAPQAQALEVVITGVQGGEMPYALYGFGTVLGCLLGLGAFPSLGVLVGLSMYLPFFYIATYGTGCLINMFVRWAKGPAWAEAWGVPFCAGLIVGDAVLRLLINCIVLVRV